MNKNVKALISATALSAMCFVGVDSASASSSTIKSYSINIKHKNDVEYARFSVKSSKRAVKNKVSVTGTKHKKMYVYLLKEKRKGSYVVVRKNTITLTGKKLSRTYDYGKKSKGKYSIRVEPVKAKIKGSGKVYYK
ncbi:hypothetical protein [Fictibacillus sp. NRS-1165]|uniref:hypothetical protein n=1 Tax=Fictibacillus sp. NRS-1165 TaxID=3144463 RepID=UPI003D1A2306